MTNKESYRNYYDIVIAPPPLEKNYAIRLSREIGGGGVGEFVLGKSHYIPHISLYHIKVAKGNIRKIHNSLKRILSDTKLGMLTLRRIKIHKEGFVWIEVSKPKWLEDLQQRVVKDTSEFRDTKFDVKGAWGGDYSVLQKELMIKHGSPYIGRFFHPHITLTVLRDNFMVKGIKFKQMRFKASSVSIYHLGPFHSCQKKLLSVYP